MPQYAPRAPSTSYLVGHFWNVFPTAFNALVSLGKYGPNFSAKYALCSSLVLVCADAVDGASNAAPSAVAARTAMTDLEFISDPFGDSGRGLALAQPPLSLKGNHP